MHCAHFLASALYSLVGGQLATDLCFWKKLKGKKTRLWLRISYLSSCVILSAFCFLPFCALSLFSHPHERFFQFSPATFLLHAWLSIFLSMLAARLCGPNVCSSFGSSTAEISQQLLDGLTWNFVQTFVLPRWWILITLASLISCSTAYRSNLSLIHRNICKIDWYNILYTQ